jgi:hypothetical protein
MKLYVLVLVLLPFSGFASAGIGIPQIISTTSSLTSIAGFINNMIRQNSAPIPSAGERGSNTGRIIRVKYNDGCLKGRQSQRSITIPYRLLIDTQWCSPNYETKWRFEGPNLITSFERSIISAYKPDQCLSTGFHSHNLDERGFYVDPREYAVITECTGGRGQRWDILVKENQIDNENKRVYFSIKQEGTNKCLHAVDFNNKYGQKMFDAWLLKECNGSILQSFYLDVPWLNYVEYLQNNLQTQNGGSSNSGGSSNNGGTGCRGVGTYSGTHDTWCRDNCALGYCPSYVCSC